MKCRTIFKEGRRVRNTRISYVADNKPRVQMIKRLLQLEVLEVANVGPHKLIVAEGSTRGIAFLVDEDRAFLLKSYGDGLLPDVAVQRTLNQIFTGEITIPFKKAPGGVA